MVVEYGRREIRLLPPECVSLIQLALFLHIGVGGSQTSTDAILHFP